MAVGRPSAGRLAGRQPRLAGRRPADGRLTAGLREYTKEDFGALENHHMLYTTYVLIVNVNVDRF